jgi:hypothetical protein
MDDDLQQDAGVESEDVIVIGEQGTESATPTDSIDDISQKTEEKTGGKKVLVPDYVPHRYERFKKQREQDRSRIQELESYIESIGAKSLDRDSYGDDVDKYVEDKTTQAADRAYAKRELDQLKQSDNSSHQKYVDDIWQSRMTEAATRYPDMGEKVKSIPNIVISGEAQLAMKENPFGPDVFYHLVSNPELANHLQYMSPSSQVQYIAQQAAVIQMQRYQPKQAPQVPQNLTTTQTPTKLVPQPIQNIKTSRPASNSINLDDYVASYRARRR